MISVLVVDDQPMMRAGFKAVLEATGAIEVVAEAGDGAKASARPRIETTPTNFTMTNSPLSQAQGRVGRCALT